MKLKYISLAIIGAAFLTACSNTDTPEPEKQDTFVSLSMGADNGAIYTKADPGPMEELGGIDSEAYIKRLTLLAFNKNNNKVYVKDTTDIIEEGTNIPLNRVGNLIVPSGDYEIFIVANGDDDLVEGLNTHDKLVSYMASIDNQKRDHLLMASQLFTEVKLEPMKVSATSDEDARLTYIYFGKDKKQESSLTPRAGTDTDPWYTLADTKPVILTRLVARIQLKSVEIALTQDLKGGSFILDSVYLTNVRPYTLLLPSTAGSYEAVLTPAPFYYRGAPKTVNTVHNLIYPAPAAYNDKWSATFTDDKKVEIADAATKTFVTTDETPFWYAYENRQPEVAPATDGIYNTRMVIAGRIFDSGGNQRTDANGNLLKSYYSVLIKGSTDLVQRNYIYQVIVKITGLGSHNPDEIMNNAALTATVEVEPWKVVIHTENITD